MNAEKNAIFEAEALPYFDAVYHFAHSLARENSFAEDLTQDTFMQAYKKFHSFELGTNCKAWLFRICKNLFIDKFRQQRRRPIHQGVDSCDPATEDKTHATRVFESNGVATEEDFLDLFGDEVNRFLKELPEEFRRALMMCDLEGLTYQEISDVENVPIGTVRSRISRARSILRDRLQEYASELGYTDNSQKNTTNNNRSKTIRKPDTNVSATSSQEENR